MMENLNQELNNVCRAGNFTRAKEILLIPDIDVNFSGTNPKLNTPLHYAAKTNTKDMVELLLELKADVNIRNKNKCVPLHHAADNNHLEIVKVLIQHGANVNAVNRWKQSALHEAATKGHTDVAAALLEANANTKLLDSNKNTALHLASVHGHTEIVSLLLKVGAHVGIVNGYQQTALHNAANMDIATLLLDAGSDVDARDQDQETPLHYAARKGAIEIVQLLLDRRADIYLVNRNQFSAYDLTESAAVMELLKTYETINVMNASNARLVTNTYELSKTVPAFEKPVVHTLSPDEEAFQRKLATINTELIEASKEGNIERVKELLAEKNIDIYFHSETKDKNTALHLACKAGHVEIVKLLITAGANLHIRNRNKKTPLHCAVEYNNIEAVKVLLAAGAEVNAVNRWRQTALHEACARGHTEIAELLLSEGASVRVVNSKRDTPLHVASAYGYTEIVNFLLSAGAYVNIVNDMGQTPLHVAGNADIAASLIASGVDLNIRDKDLETALHYEAKKGRVEIVRLLLDAGADVFIVNKNDYSPYDMAESKEIMDMIKEAGEKRSKVAREVQAAPSQVELDIYMRERMASAEHYAAGSLAQQQPTGSENLVVENMKLTAQIATLHAEADKKQIQLEKTQAALVKAQTQMKKIQSLYEKLFGNLDITAENKSLIVARLDRFLQTNESIDIELQDLDFSTADVLLPRMGTTFETEFYTASPAASTEQRKKCTIM